MPSEYITDQSGRYVRLKWRRDQHEPGYVQIATGAPGVDGEFVDLDGRSIDKLIKGLHKAKNQAFGESMATKADRGIKTWRKDLAEGADPAAARAKVWSSFGYSDEEIARLEAALRSGVGTVPSYHSGGAVVPTEPVYATLAEDEHVLRDVTEVGQSERMWICARSEHAGQLCQERPYTWAEITAVPQPIRFDPPEVTVESDASAAARLDTDRYRATRRGDR